jgi:hypothetical protein
MLVSLILIVCAFFAGGTSVWYCAVYRKKKKLQQLMLPHYEGQVPVVATPQGPVEYRRG